MLKECFGEYCAFSDECDRCYELNKHCKVWKNNMFNFKRRRNLAKFVCFLIIVVWNVRIGSDFLKIGFHLLAILNLMVALIFFLALTKNIKSRKIAMEAYQKSIETKGSVKINTHKHTQ